MLLRHLSVLPLRVRVTFPLCVRGVPVLPGDLPGPVHVPGLLRLLLLSLILLVEVSLLEVMLRKVSAVECGCRRTWLVLEKDKNLKMNRAFYEVVRCLIG